MITRTINKNQFSNILSHLILLHEPTLSKMMNKTLIALIGISNHQHEQSSSACNSFVLLRSSQKPVVNSTSAWWLGYQFMAKTKRKYEMGYSFSFIFYHSFSIIIECQYLYIFKVWMYIMTTVVRASFYYLYLCFPLSILFVLSFITLINVSRVEWIIDGHKDNIMNSIFANYFLTVISNTLSANASAISLSNCFHPAPNPDPELTKKMTITEKIRWWPSSYY